MLCGRQPCSRDQSIPAWLCKRGHKCDTCANLEKQGGCYNNQEWRHCTVCKKCEECRLNLHKESLSHPTDSTERGKITQYCTLCLNNEGNTVEMKVNSTTGKSHYSSADDLTKAVICDYLDKYGVLVESGVPLPPGYQRRMKYVRRDALPVQRTSKRPAGHKQETISCPVRMCEDRTGNCKCQCRICRGFSDSCTCCKTCQSREEKCTCCKTCGNIENECICTILEFLSLWSL